MRWLKENPKATDQDLHMFLRSLGVNPAAGEQVVMDMARGNDAPGSPKPSPKQAVTDRKPPPTPAVGKPDLRQEQVSSNHRMDGRRRFNSNPNHLPSRFEEDSAVKPGRAKPQRRRFDRIKGGKGDDLEPDQVDPRELKLGIEVEMEHTKSRSLAQEIALDHLAESPNYYSRLKKIHKD